jgi:tRNA-Thr(GGU) m(6)t(6)A37 methyltransferase TsaA
MSASRSYEAVPIGWVRSTLVRRAEAPKQGSEGAPNARVEVRPEYAAALEGLAPGEDILLFTWLHESDRTALKVHPRGDESRPLTGVFATRSPARPNPIGLHRVRLLAIAEGPSLHVSNLEAIDGTPVLDIKPVLTAMAEG